ncbi:MAG: endonuclease III domain-containing protein [Deltaproteobacteria bacterium]|nr:endonuclease III domain-containing protein [Deltaproteobacteria bacterium]MCB9488425.1 endonuclease III domain-containing protein [Deltaproteobacteria bacterium]
MSRHFGRLHWWPGETPFEVCVGAILTQNTAWTNVEKAIANLKAAGALDCNKIATMPESRLAELIRPSGYFNQKAARLRDFARFLLEGYEGRVEAMASRPIDDLREELLSLKGIGPETADSILLYALEMPSFVIDAYTKRIFSRKGAFDGKIDYHDAKAYFEKRVERDVDGYNEFHAQIVMLGKDYCRKSDPRCDTCPIRGL